MPCLATELATIRLTYGLGMPSPTMNPICHRSVTSGGNFSGLRRIRLLLNRILGGIEGVGLDGTWGMDDRLGFE